MNIVKWFEDTFIYKDRVLRKSVICPEKFIKFEQAKKIMSWTEDDFYTYRYKAFVNRSGNVVLHREKYFIRLKNVDIYYYETVKEFMDNWFPKPTIEIVRFSDD